MVSSMTAAGVSDRAISIEACCTQDVAAAGESAVQAVNSVIATNAMPITLPTGTNPADMGEP